MKTKCALFALLMILSQLSACYVIKQGFGQFKLQISQIPIDEAIKVEKDHVFRELLIDVPEIKTFAVESLYLTENDNYTRYLKLESEGVSFVVTACPKLKLEPYTWWFPIVGSVPYKGFFNKADALSLEAELTSKGYDTWMFAAPAYSTLGWFRDPVTTPMLRKGLYSLANTIIHEMVHTTAYIEGQGDFNEQLASFIGQKGALQYLKKRKQVNDEKMNQLLVELEKRNYFAETVQKVIPILEAIYTAGTSQEEIIEKRAKVFSEIRDEAIKFYPNASKEEWTFNNARILQYKRYNQDAKLFKEIWEESGEDWRKFWERIDLYTKERKWNS